MLKKLFVFPLVFLLTLCGCAAKETVKPILNNIEFIARIDYDGKNYVCNSMLVDEKISMNVIEPENIKGFSVSVDKAGAKAGFGDIAYDFDISADVVNTLYAIIDEVGKTEGIMVKNDNGVIEGNINGHSYIFAFSPAGLPISLNITEPNIKIEFYNVTIKSKSEG